MPPVEYLTAVRLRLGADFAAEPLVYGACSRGVLDRRGAHALCCASAEATVGHYAVRDAAFQLVSLADSSAETEVEGLIPSHPSRRPADILTGAALPGSLAALDVGVCSPDAVGAGSDCVESMRRRKVREYEQHLAELAEQNILYRPCCFSAYGRAHPDATALLTNVAKRASRRRGLADHSLLLRRSLVKIGVAIQRRAARMVLACLPQPAGAAADLLHGADIAGGQGAGEPIAGATAAGHAGSGLVSAGGISIFTA